MLRSFFTFILLLAAVLLSAETITLKTGKVIQGTVLFENDDVLVIKDASGARFQYPKSDVASRVGEAEANVASEQQAATVEQKKVSDAKKLSLALEVAGGAAILPGKTAGGLASADLLICSHHIGDKRVMLGGQVGYHVAFKVEDKTYSFLPIAAVVRYPILEGKHSPLIGAGIGYGIGLSKNYQGGVFADALVAYRYEINKKSALYVGLDVQFQQAKINTTETIVDADGETKYEYENKQGVSFVTPAIKIGLAF